MPKLTDEQIADYRQWNNHQLSDALYQSRADRSIQALLDHIATLTTELEDTRAAYQLTRHQLDAHRRGQGTYQGENR